MKFIEETTALCKRCNSDKLCKAHIVEMNNKEFLRIFCAECGDTFLELKENPKWKKRKKVYDFFKKIHLEKSTKILIILALIGLLSLLACFVYRLVW